jgi:chromosome segregation ATPase
LQRIADERNGQADTLKRQQIELERLGDESKKLEDALTSLHNEKEEAMRILNELQTERDKLKEEKAKESALLLSVKTAQTELSGLHSIQEELLSRARCDIEALNGSLKQKEEQLETLTGTRLAQREADKRLTELLNENASLLQKVEQLLGNLSKQQTEKDDLAREKDQINLEREDLAQGLRDKHATMLTLHQQLEELEQTKARLAGQLRFS